MGAVKDRHITPEKGELPLLHRLFLKRLRLQEDLLVLVKAEAAQETEETPYPPDHQPDHQTDRQDEGQQIEHFFQETGHQRGLPCREIRHKGGRAASPLLWYRELVRHREKLQEPAYKKQQPIS